MLASRVQPRVAIVSATLNGANNRDLGLDFFSWSLLCALWPFAFL